MYNPRELAPQHPVCKLNEPKVISLNDPCTYRPLQNLVVIAQNALIIAVSEVDERCRRKEEGNGGHDSIADDKKVEDEEGVIYIVIVILNVLELYNGANKTRQDEGRLQKAGEDASCECTSVMVIFAVYYVLRVLATASKAMGQQNCEEGSRGEADGFK
ncbi:hypothetical protein L7F22_054970 [Adiantum nelumboides]|nr:hypothetical protein [Adiantum nelumboides]